MLRPPLALGPVAKFQTALETAAFSFQTIPADPDTVASMSLNPLLEHITTSS
jgi:hypothetical protein